jgi:hypothetical protein
MNDVPADARALEMPDTGERGLWWVAVFLQDRVYGGPEEGGWYFDCGTLVTDPDIYATLQVSPAAFTTRADASLHADRMRTGLAALNEGRRPIWSVLSEGIYEVEEIQADPLPRYYPEYRPTYE